MENKKHLTENEVFEMAADKLNISNLNVDKIVEIAAAIDLEYDEQAEAYLNPNYIEEEKIVSFNTAKLAAAKGFKKETHIKGAGHRKYDEEGEIIFGSIKHFDDSVYFEAPAEKLIKEWLLDNFNIMVKENESEKEIIEALNKIN